MISVLNYIYRSISMTLIVINMLNATWYSVGTQTVLFLTLVNYSMIYLQYDTSFQNFDYLFTNTQEWLKLHLQRVI